MWRSPPAPSNRQAWGCGLSQGGGPDGEKNGFLETVLVMTASEQARWAVRTPGATVKSRRVSIM